MCHGIMENEIMNNVFQQVMKGEKVTQSKEFRKFSKISPYFLEKYIKFARFRQ
jgi:hypothetical protein